MKFSKSKWLGYTFLVGLIPVLIRLLVAWIIATSWTVSPLAASDFVAFGLLLHISIINELEHIQARESERDWKTVHNVVSIIFIAIYSALYALTLIGEKNTNLIDANMMLRSVIVIALVSSLLVLTVVHRLSKLN
jgi:hypothetical protein